GSTGEAPRRRLGRTRACTSLTTTQMTRAPRVRRARRSVTVLRESSYPCGGSHDRDCSVTASQPAKKTKILRFVLQKKPEILCVSVSPWRVLRVSQVESVAS